VLAVLRKHYESDEQAQFVLLGWDALSKIDQAIDESILEASAADLREDLAEQGDDLPEPVGPISSMFDFASSTSLCLVWCL
jgi:hypothetical protein